VYEVTENLLMGSSDSFMRSGRTAMRQCLMCRVANPSWQGCCSQHKEDIHIATVERTSKPVLTLERHRMQSFETEYLGMTRHDNEYRAVTMPRSRDIVACLYLQWSGSE